MSLGDGHEAKRAALKAEINDELFFGPFVVRNGRKGKVDDSYQHTGYSLSVATAARKVDAWILESTGWSRHRDYVVPRGQVEFAFDYLRHTPRQTNLLRVQDEGFTYLFDYYSALGEDPGGLKIEDRLVCAFGTSRVGLAKRNVGRQRGWIGPTEKRFGVDRDKGHYIPHSLGGGLEINLFDQSRALNRGRSVSGGVYRRMERYCLEHPGIFLFNRPFYADSTAKPAMLEFGLLRIDAQLWVERFEN